MFSREEANEVLRSNSARSGFIGGWPNEARTPRETFT